MDRIVPGTPSGEQRARIVAELGYEDALLTVCEVYRLFAIEAGDAAPRLRFAAAVEDAIEQVKPLVDRKRHDLAVLWPRQEFTPARWAATDPEGVGLQKLGTPVLQNHAPPGVPPSGDVFTYRLTT